MAFDIGQVIRNATLLAAARRQPAEDALREQYLGTQIAGAQQAQQQSATQFQQQQALSDALQQYHRSTLVLSAQDPKQAASVVAPNLPAVYDSVHGQGAWQQATPDQVRQLAQHIQQRAQVLIGPQQQVQWVSDGTQLLPQDKTTGRPIPGLTPIPLGVSPGAKLSADVTMRGQDLAARTRGVPAGYELDPTNPGALRPRPGGPADKSQATDNLGDPTLTGDAYLQSIQDIGFRKLVKAVAEGRIPVPRIYRSSKAGEIGATQIAAAVAQYDPTYNAQDYNSRNRTRIAFTSGPQYKNMTALNQLAAHLGQLSNQVEGTSGLAIPGIGGYVNRAVNAGADPYTGKVTAYDSTADAVAHETRTLFAGAGSGTLQELEGYLKSLDSSNSTAQKRAAIQNIARLAQSRIAILREGYQQGMGKAGEPFATTFPHAATVLNQLSGEGDEASSTATGPVPVRTDADYARLPSGAQYVAPDGSVRRKQ